MTSGSAVLTFATVTKSPSEISVYAEEAPLFARLSDQFEHCVLGLALIREELGNCKDAATTEN